MPNTNWKRPYLRWGVGKMIVQSVRKGYYPIVLPFYHDGLKDILPCDENDNLINTAVSDNFNSKETVTSADLRKELFEGRDLNSTIDSRAIYASAMSTVFDVDFKRIQKEVFWGDKLDNLSDKLFKA